MAYSSLPFPGNTSLENLRVIAEDTVIYVGITGDDSTGTGTVTAPFRTLSKAMNVARDYIISGNAVLTVRLLRGEYTLDSNVDLYHPQGGNLVIEGDPNAFRQRTLYKVDSYTWSVSQFAGGGHTATIRVFDGTTAGATYHGFTAIDQGTYFTVVNAAIGARSNYRTNGASGGTANGGIHGPVLDGFQATNPFASSYANEYYGDRMFNHGYSFENGNAVLGIGRIIGATTSGMSLSVQFNNANYDGRCPGWEFNGGIANTNPWCAVPSNYPETQYSVPTGYYGWEGWKNENGSAVYPLRGTDTWITNDPYVMSTYPVVLRADYASNVGTLYLKGGTLRALRNLFFANNSAPYTLTTGVTGATLNFSQGISALVDNSYPPGTNGTAIALENATIGIRHLGFLGTGTAISAFGSTVTKYTDTTLDTADNSGTTRSTLGTIRWAVLNSLDNAPVICTTQCENGIVSKNSTIDFTDGSGLNREYGVDYRDSSVYLDTHGRSLQLFNTQFRATSVFSHGSVHIPRFFFYAVVPVFPGTTFSSGLTSAFNTHTNPVTFNPWAAYPLATVSLDGQVLGYINNWAFSSAANLELAGSTTSATYIGTPQPTEYQQFVFFGVKTAPAGLSYMSLRDVRLGITANNANAGGTLQVRFFRDAAGTNLASSYTIGQKSVLVSGANGVTMGVLGIAGTSASAFIQQWNSYGTDSSYMGNYARGEEHRSAIGIFDCSTVAIEKAMIIYNGGQIPVQVVSDSKLHIGGSHHRGNIGVNQSNQNGESTPIGSGYYNYADGVLCITGYGLGGLYAWRNCDVRVGSVFVKHSAHLTSLEPSGTGSFLSYPVRAGHNSRVSLAFCIFLMPPALTSVLHQSTNTSANENSWRSRDGTGYGWIPFGTARTNGAIIVEDSSLISQISGISGAFYACHWDGGNPNFENAANRNQMLITADGGSQYQYPKALALQVSSAGAQTMSSSLRYRFTSDPRTTADRRNAKRSSGTNTTFYNTPRQAARPWTAYLGNGPNTTQSGIGFQTQYIVNAQNIPVYTFTENMAVPATGITFTAEYTRFGAIKGS